MSTLTLEDLLDALEDVAQVGQPSGRSVRILNVGTDPFMQFFTTEIIDGLVAAGGATFRIFEGPYGSGKSHLLFKIREDALDNDLAVVHTDLSAGLKLEDWQLITRHVLQNLELRTPHGPVRSLPRILSAISDRMEESTPSAPSLPHPGFERAIRLYLKPGTLTTGAHELLSQFLLGDRVSVAALHKAGVTGVKHPLNSRNAQHVLRTVVAMLRRFGVRGTVLLFDENEEVFRMTARGPSKRVRRGANLLRHLIDATASGGLEATAAVFATLPGFLASCREAYPALGQRIDVSGDAEETGWRSPVLSIRRVANGMTPETFLDELVARILELANRAGVGSMLDRADLIDAGSVTLQSHAGEGYRRELTKCVASMARLRLSPISAL